jgi:hypothetical protein
VEKGVPSDLRCSYATSKESATPVEQLRPLFEERTVTGRPIASRFADKFGLGVSAARLTLVVFVHVVGKRTTSAGFTPIRDQAYVDDIFATANDIWSQACIKLVPYTTPVVTTFEDLPISAFVGTCLADAQRALVEPLDVTAEGTTLLNLYLVDDTTGDACGSPITGHIIMPTAGQLSTSLGKVLAHELGHVLLNPLGVDDSDNPDHVMHHPERHPGEPSGNRDGLHLSDCIGAHARALEDYGAWAQTGVPGASSSEPCVMRPRLGSNIAIIEEMMQA